MSADCSSQRRVTKTYGRRSLSSAARHASIPVATADSSSSDDDSSDGQVADALLGSPSGGGVPERVKSGAKSVVTRLKSAPAGCAVGGTGRAAGKVKERAEGAGTQVTAVGASRVEWDEDVARRAVGTGRGVVAAMKGRTPRTALPLPSPSPPKRTRVAVELSSSVPPSKPSPRRAATTGSPSSSTASPVVIKKRVDPPTVRREVSARRTASNMKGKEKEVVQDREQDDSSTAVEDNSPPRRKRPRIKVTSAQASPVISGTLTPIPASSQSQPPVPAKPTPPSEPRVAVPPTIPSTSNPITSTSAAPRTPTRPPAPSSPIQAPSSRPTTPLRSPAKNLASVFSSFAKPTDEGTPKGKKLGRTTSGVVANMGVRSVPSDPLVRADSFPLLSSPTASPSCALTPSPSLPSALPSQSQLSRPPSPTKRPLSRNTSLIDSSRSVVGGPKTYGGVRSFKRDVEEDRLFGPGPSTLDEGRKSSPAGGSERKSLKPKLPVQRRERKTYAVLRREWGVDEEEGLGESELKSVTQLRAKGENARFVDEFDYLVEGLVPSMGLGVRRASAVEVLRKVLEVDFVRKLKASGFVERVYLEFRKAEAGDGDRALDPALAFLVATLARDQRIAEPLLRVTTSTFSKVAQGEDAIFEEPTCDVLVVLSRMLALPWTGEEIGGAVPAKGFSKQDVRVLSNVRQIINSSKIADEGSLPVTLRSLCLIAISIIASFPPRTFFRPQHLICSSGALDAVILTLINETRGLEVRMSRYANGLDLLPADGSINLRLIDMCLHIFEACSSTTEDTHYLLTSHLSTLAPSLAHLVLACHILACGSDAPASTAMDVLLSALRLLIDLTTHNPEWSIALAQSPLMVSTLVKLIVATRTKAARAGQGRFRSMSTGEGLPASEGVESEEKPAVVNVKFDVLCLTLGVLTNMVESVEGVKDDIRMTHPDCKEQKRCALQCQCVDRKSAVLRLTDLYLDPLDDSENELNTSFINGYSGILVGLIMLDVPLNQDLVISALRSHPTAMKNLVEAMEEFATLHETSERAERVDAMEGVEESQESNATEVEESVVTSGIAVSIRGMLEGLRRKGAGI